jgi:hypothetical protein
MRHDSLTHSYPLPTRFNINELSWDASDGETPLEHGSGSPLINPHDPQEDFDVVGDQQLVDHDFSQFLESEELRAGTQGANSNPGVVQAVLWCGEASSF